MLIKSAGTVKFTWFIYILSKTMLNIKWQQIFLKTYFITYIKIQQSMQIGILAEHKDREDKYNI